MTAVSLFLVIAAYPSWWYRLSTTSLSGRMGVWEEGREGGKVGEMEVLSQRSRESSRGKRKWGLLPLTGGGWLCPGGLIIWGSESFFSEGLTCGAFDLGWMSLQRFLHLLCQVSWDYHRSGSTFYVCFSLWRFLNHSGRMNLTPRSMWGSAMVIIWEIFSSLAIAPQQKTPQLLCAGWQTFS